MFPRGFYKSKMKARSIIVVLPLFCLSLLFLNIKYAEAEDKLVQKYNLVIILFDTLRADYGGWYGYFRGTTPRID